MMMGVISIICAITMVIAQMILITPIIIALSCQVLEDLHEDYKDFFESLVVPKRTALIAYIVDARYSLITVVLAGFGRAVSEVATSETARPNPARTTVISE